MNRADIEEWKSRPNAALTDISKREFLQLCDLALRGLEAGEPLGFRTTCTADAAPASAPSGMVAVPRGQLQKWHAVTAQLCGADEWGREMQDQMWAMISAAPEVKP